MKGKRKKPQGFFSFVPTGISKKIKRGLDQSHYAVGVAGLIIGLVAAQAYPAITQASAGLLQPSPSPAPQAHQIGLGEPGKPHPAVPAVVSPLKAAEPTPEPTPSPSPEPATEEPEAAPPAPPAVPGLIGSIGYAVAWGNCVNEPGVNNPGFGNPISWPVLSSEPSIGATALFTWNHTGVVTGVWSNGDVEVRHQNYWGGQHRFPRSTFRGFR